MTMNSSEYINKERRTYSLYVLQTRAIPSMADGLKAAGRRILWIGRDGKTYKSANLAGATMPLHPHAAPESAVNTLAAPFGNNIPLLKGEGQFGTLLRPTAYGASRYTSVKVSEFTKNVVFKDIEIIPMIPNYDDTLQEPKHFLPLVPIVLLNPSEGIAVGFATNILGRSLDDIINAQLAHLTSKKIKEAFPTFIPTRSIAVSHDTNNSSKWTFEGNVETINASTIKITALPYGLSHEKLIKHLIQLEEKGDIEDFDDNSRQAVDITIKLKRNKLKEIESNILSFFNLINVYTENMNVLDVDGERVVSTSFENIIKTFTDWRLNWYTVRYQRLADLLIEDIQKYKDIITAIKKNVGGLARTIKSKQDLIKRLESFNIIHTEYIASLPVYRFTEEEKKKVEDKLKEAEKTLKWYHKLLSSKDECKKIYVQELKEVLNDYKQGKYNV